MTTDNPEAVKVVSGLIANSSTFVTSLCTWVETEDSYPLYLGRGLGYARVSGANL